MRARVCDCEFGVATISCSLSLISCLSSCRVVPVVVLAFGRVLLFGPVLSGVLSAVCDVDRFGSALGLLGVVIVEFLELLFELMELLLVVDLVIELV